MQPKVKADLHDIWMAEIRDEAHKAFDHTLKRFEAKSPKAMECLAKDREERLALYDYLAEHPLHQPDRADLRHGPSAEQAQSELRFPGDAPGDGFHSAPERRKTLEAYQGVQKLELVVNNVRFQDGEQVIDRSDRTTA